MHDARISGVKVTLVQPPLGNEHGVRDDPLHRLHSLGRALREESVDVEVLDLNEIGVEDCSSVEPEHFYEEARDLIVATDPQIVGFTSIALESHVCLELAHLLKDLDPSLITIFGGPQFSSIVVDAMHGHPWMDFVVCGEAHRSVTELVRYLRGDGGTRDLRNVARRAHAGVVFEPRRHP